MSGERPRGRGRKKKSRSRSRSRPREYTLREKHAAAKKLQGIYRAGRALRRVRMLVRSVVQKVYDPATGAYYFYNTNTGESTWTQPVLLGNEEFEKLPESASLEEKAQATASMASDWEEFTDEYSGAVYYYNKVTQENVWEKPQVVQQAEDAKKAWLGEDWEELVNETGAKYYYNNKTDMSQWVKPSPEQLAESRGESVKDNEAAESPRENENENEDQEPGMDDEEYYAEEKKEEEEETVLIDGVRVPVGVPTEEDLVQDELRVAERKRIWDRRDMIAEETRAQRCRRLLKYRVKKCAREEHSQLDLMSLNAKKIPEKVYELTHGLNVLALSNNLIEKIPEDVKSLTKLTSLSLRQNRLKSIPPQLWYFTELVDLDLRENQIPELPQEVGNLTTLRDINIWELGIDNMKSLCCLRLDGNCLRQLPEELGKVVTLKTLTVSRNEIEHLPSTITELHALEEFECAQNKLVSLPENFGESLSGLITLDISHNAIEELPQDIGFVSQLTRFDAGGNKLKALPESFYDLRALEWLSLCKNKLAKLAKAVGRFASLEHLDISENRFKSIPGSFKKLKSLRRFAATGNKLTSIRTELCAAVTLEHVDLCDNAINEIPGQIGDLRSLLSLKLSGNKLLGIPLEMARLGKLELLDLSKNVIEKLPGKFPFRGWASLQRLRLSENKLKAIPRGFGELGALSRLDASHNILSVILPDFGRLGSLEWLDMSHNRLQQLPGTFADLSSLSVLRLSYNKFRSPPTMLDNLPNLHSWALHFNPIAPPTLDDLDRLASKRGQQLCASHAVRALDEGKTHQRKRNVDAARESLAEAVEALGKMPSAAVRETKESRHYEFDARRFYVGTVGSAAAYTEGLVERDLGNHSSAVDKFTESIQQSLSANLHMYYARGRSFLESRNASAALGDFNRVLRGNADYLPALCGRAAAQIELGQYKEALQDGDTVLASKVDHVEGRLYHSIAHMKLCNLEEALKGFRLVVQKSKDDRLLVMAYYNRGLIYRDLGQHKNAITEFEKAIVIFEQLIECALEGSAAHKHLQNKLYVSHMCRASTWRSLGQTEKAGKAYDEAMGLKPGMVSHKKK